MTIATDLYNTLNTNAGVRAIVGINTSPQHSRIYPVHAAETATVPLISYSLISGTRVSTLVGVGDQERQLIQINCVQTSFPLAETLVNAVYSALEGNGWQAAKNDFYDEQTRTYMIAIDWIFRA
jgi:hypothetical protein